MRSLANALGGCRSRLALVALAISFVLTPPAQAQLNENCVISILNRTAQVQPDGSWRIDNVPANFYAEIVLGAVDPIPIALNVTAPSSTQTSAGATAFLELALPQ